MDCWTVAGFLLKVAEIDVLPFMVIVVEGDVRLFPWLQELKI